MRPYDCMRLQLSCCIYRHTVRPLLDGEPALLKALKEAFAGCLTLICADCLQGYLPGQLYNLNSHYGNKEELQALLKAFKEAGVVPVADIVINHRCADAQDENGVWNTFRCALLFLIHSLAPL